MALSTRPGGSAEKMGTNYENIWAVRCMLDVLDGTQDSIHIEQPDEDGAEFFLEKNGAREYWQVKRQITTQRAWSLTSLRDVIVYFHEKFKSHHTTVFASISDAPELRVLIENAQAAIQAGGDLQYLKAHFLSQKNAKNFKELIQILQVSKQESFEFLCSVRIEGGREITLEKDLHSRLNALFNHDAKATYAVLADFYLTSIHESLNASKIEEHLSQCNITRRRNNSAADRDKITSITNSYLAGQQSKLIRHTLIERREASDILSQLENTTSSLNFLITADAGGGKSACLSQIVIGLQKAHIPVLAFRLDRISSVQTSILLGEELGLSESPAIALSETYQSQSVVIVIDQLDCVSLTSGRKSDFFDTVAALYDEIIGLRSKRHMHVILACRQFDFEHDHRLKRFLEKNQHPIKLSLFTPEEVATTITKEDGSYTDLTHSQQKMLQLPQHLALYIEADLAKTNSSFSTSKELCDAYWDHKRQAIGNANQHYDTHWLPCISHLSQQMSERQELSIPTRSMDQFSPQFLQVMTSEGVTTYDGKRYGFGHELFFDYCFARTQPNNGKDFILALGSDRQDLFRRAQVRQILAFMRDDDHENYLMSVTSLLKNDDIRPHIKLLLVPLISSHPQPSNGEFQVLLPWIESAIESCQNGDFQTSSLSMRVLDSFLSSQNLFAVANRLGHIQAWLKTQNAWLQNTMARYLKWQTHEHGDQVAHLIEPFADDPEWEDRLCHIMEGGDLHKSRQLFEFFLRLLKNGALDDARCHLASNGSFWSMLYGFP